MNDRKTPHIMAIDVALRHTGVAIIDPMERLVHSECLVTKKASKKLKMYKTDDDLNCVREIVNGLRRLLDEYHVTIMVGELALSGGQTASSCAALALSKALIGTMVEFTGLPFLRINPMDVKIAMTGNRTASKKQMQDTAFTMWGQDPKWVSAAKCSKTGYTMRFEHIADALGAFMASKNSPEMKLWLDHNKPVTPAYSTGEIDLVPNKPTNPFQV